LHYKFPFNEFFCQKKKGASMTFVIKAPVKGCDVYGISAAATPPMPDFLLA